MRTTLALVPFALLTACSFADKPDTYADVLPDDRLILEAPGDLSTKARAAGDPSEYQPLTVQITNDVNTGLSDVLRLLDEVTAFDPTWSSDEDDLALWGPWEDDGFNGQLWVKHLGNDAFEWAFELKPVASDTWTPVLAGHVEEGATAETSKGRFALDFTAIDDLGAGDGVSGAVVADYTIRADGASATVYFGEILDENGEIPQDAAYVFDHTIGAGGTMDVAVTEDVTDEGVLELLILRSRWDGDGAGRTDALVTDGDLGELVYTASECWSPAATVVYYEDNYEMVSVGEEADCAFAEAEYPQE